MLWFEPLIIVGAVSFVGLVVFLHFYLKKKGKSLGGDCSHNCSSCGHQCPSCKEMLKEYKEMYSEK